jgi:hypothetical protein
MNEQQLAAVKQAVEALMVFRYAPPAQRPLVLKAIADLEQAIAQDALYKMAEDAVTIGLSYNDWPKIGCVNHDCDKCKAVQEPVAWFKHGPYEDGEQLSVVFKNPHDDICYSPLGFIDAPPAAQKPWVGLTDEEMEKLSVENGKATFLNDDEETDMLWFDGDCFALLKAAEAKLKEKNT